MSEPSEVIIPLFGVLDVTGEVVVMWIILAVLAAVSLIVTRDLKERPGRFQNLIEMGVEYLDNFFAGIIGKEKSRKYFYFLGSLFLFILFANYSGLFPGVGMTKYAKAPTSSLSVTLGAPLIMMVLSLLFCFIQAVVFTMLTTIYLDEATEIEEYSKKIINFR